MEGYFPAPAPDGLGLSSGASFCKFIFILIASALRRIRVDPKSGGRMGNRSLLPGLSLSACDWGCRQSDPALPVENPYATPKSVW